MPTPTREDLTRAAASLYVKLAADPLTALLAGAVMDRETLAKALEPYILHANSSWLAAGSEVADHLALAIATNPYRPIQEVLVQADVQDALTIPFQEAGQATMNAIDAAWQHGVTLGFGSASKELASLGLPISIPTDLAPDDAVLKLLESDVQANIDKATKAFADATKTTTPDALAAKLKKLTEDFGRRGKYSTELAGNYGSQAAKEKAFAHASVQHGADIKKMWVTRFGPGTCGMCAALHGTVQDLGFPFPPGLTWGKHVPAYGGKLNHPPRHPNCRCLVVPVLVGAKTKALKSQAEEWWTKNGS